MKNIIHCSVLTIAFAMQAQADLKCATATSDVAVKLFRLGGFPDKEFAFYSQNAAAIIKKNGESTLLTGKVTDIPMRAGNRQTYDLVDNAGQSATITVVQLSYAAHGCTRAGCLSDPFSDLIEASLSYLGEEHALTCEDF